MVTTIQNAANAQFRATWYAPLPAPDDELGQRLHKAWSVACSALDGLSSKCAAIEADPDLSGSGKTKALTALSAEFLARLQAPSETLTAGEAEIVRLSTQLESEGRAQVTDAIKIPRALFLLEWFGSLEKEKQVSALEEAVRSKDKELLGSVLTAPSTWLAISAPWFTLQHRQRIEDAFASQVNPLVVSRRDGLKVAVQCLSFAIEQVSLKIQSETGTTANEEDAMRARLKA